MPLRIVQAIGSLDPDTGGPPAVFWRLSAAQATLGHTVWSVGAREPSRDPLIDEAKRNVVGIDRVRSSRVAMPHGRWGLMFDRQVAHAVERAGREMGGIDVVHLHGVWDCAVVGTSAWCRSHRVPYIIRPAGMLDVWSLQRSKWKKKLAMWVAHRKMLRGAAAIHALNAHERNAIALLDLGVPIEVIPNGVFLEEVDVPSDIRAFRASLPGLADRPYVLFLSRLHYKKGLDILADAWAIVSRSFPEHRLVIAGPRDDDSIDDFRRRVAGAGVQGTVIEAGPVYGAMKAAAFHGCDCFVLPSRQEGFSVAITEALALSAPVVVSRECHFPEVTEVGAGIETSLEPSDVAAGLSKMLGDGAFRRGAGETGARLVRERFLWPRIAEQTIRLYQRILSAS